MPACIVEVANNVGEILTPRPRRLDTEADEAVNNVWRLIRDGLSNVGMVRPLVFAWVAPVLLIRNFQFLAPGWAGEVWVFTLAAAGAVCAAALALWLGWLVFLRSPTGRPRHFSLAICCFLLAGSANWLVLNAAEPTVIGPARIGWFGGLIQSVLFVTMWLVATSTIAYAIKSHETTNRSLREHVRALTDTRETTQASLDWYARELSHRVVGELLPMLEELATQARILKNTRSKERCLAFAKRLRDVAQTSIRPISHELESSPTQAISFPNPARGMPPVEYPTVREHPTFRQRFSAVLHLSFTGDPIRTVGPPSIGLIALLSTASAPTLALPFAATAFAINVATLKCLHAALPTRIWNRSPARSAALLSAVYAVGGIVSVASVPILTSTVLTTLPVDPDLKWQLWTIPAAVSGLACGWCWSLARALSIRLAQENRDLEAAAVAQQWELGALESSLTDVRRRISHVIHTDVQGIVAGCGGILERSADQSDDATADALAQINFHLARTRTILTDTLAEPETHAADIRGGLNQLAKAWQGIVRVAIDLSTTAKSALELSSALSRTVVDCVGEAVSNAAIHGMARTVTVNITHDEHAVVITVTDDGVGPQPELTLGRGLSRIAGVATQWNLIPGELSGATLTVTLPCVSVDFLEGLQVDSLKR